MSEDYADDNLEAKPYCEDCRVLTDAVWDIEQQRREAEDEHLRIDSFRSSNDLHDTEETYLARLEKLRRRRDSALEVLLKHQRLEHM